MSDYALLLERLRNFKAQNDSGFEGLIRDCLETLSSRTAHIQKSGAQGGKDLLFDADPKLPLIAIESKRFGAKTPLPLDELAAKLKDACRTTPEMDVWGLVLPREMKEPDWSELRRIGAEYGVTLMCMDWRDAPGSLPAIAAICCAGRHIAEARLGADLAPMFDRIEAHADYHRISDDFRRQLRSPETGFHLACQAAQAWLKTTLSSASTSRQMLRSHADLLGADAHFVSRPEIDRAIDRWWQAGAHSPAVLLGDEGRGKTWTALKWCFDTSDKPDAPLTIATPAKLIRSEDVGEVLAAAMGKCLPAVRTSEIRARLERWMRSDGPNRILLVVDGLNERWSVNWHDFVRMFEVPPWKNKVCLLLTSRTGYWQDDLLRLKGAAEEAVTEITVPKFSEIELDQYLATYGLKRAQLPSGLLKIIRTPRFARLAITLKDKLGDDEDLTEARLVLEDWRSRLDQRDLRVDDDSLLEFVAGLGKDFLQDRNFSISAKDIHARLSADSGRDLEHYRTTISEIVEGSWLERGDKPHRYKVNKSLLPYVIGLDLARAIEDAKERPAADDIIAKYQEQLRGADMGVAILRAAASMSFARQRATPVALEALLEAWVRSQNFGPADFDEMWPLVSRRPNLFLDAAERAWKGSPVTHGEGEVLAKGLANAAKWSAVHQALVDRLPGWVGSYGTDPLRWHHGESIPESADRKARTAKALAAWQTAEPTYARNVSRHFRPEADDWLPEGAFAIISYLKRAPFADTLITWAVTRAIMQHDAGAEQVSWLLRLNGEDHEDTEAAILREAATLRQLAEPVASRAADVLLAALASPRATKAASKTPTVARHHLGKSQPELDAAGPITWRDLDAARNQAPIEWLEGVARFAPDPDAVLSGDDQRRLERIAADLTHDPIGNEFILEREAVTLALARWAPPALAQLVRREVVTLATRESAPRSDPALRIEELSLILRAQEREALLHEGLQRLQDLVPAPADKERVAERRLKNLIAAGLIGKTAAEQVEVLKALQPSFGFSHALARCMAPLETTDAERILDMLAAEKDENVIASWLDYMGWAGFKDVPSNASILIELTRSENKAVRGEAIALIRAAKSEALGRAFVDSGWSHVKGQERIEALEGTNLLCKYGAHVPLDDLRGRIVPQALPSLVQRRGCAEAELQQAYSYVEELLDEEIGGARTTRYGYQHIFSAKDAWKRIVAMNDGALIAKMRQATDIREDLGFFNVFPLIELVSAILEVNPKEGVAIWSAVKAGQRRYAFSSGDFNNLAFSISGHAELAEVRRQLLGMARNDAELADVVLMALLNGHEAWLVDVITEDLGHANAGRIARGLTLAGFLDRTEGADRLWREDVEARAFAGWLAVVRDSARLSYKRNKDARHWLDQYLSTTDPESVFGWLTLAIERSDGRFLLWSRVIGDRRKELEKTWLLHLDATAQDRKLRRKTIEDQRKRLLYATRTSAGMSPWL